MRLLAPAKRSRWKRQWLEFVAVKPLSVAVSFGAERIVTKRDRRSPRIDSRGYEPRRTSTVAPDGAASTAQARLHQGVVRGRAAETARLSLHDPPIEPRST